MKRRFEAIITLASWEPRYALGVRSILDEYEVPDIFITYFFKEYAKLTSDARLTTKSMLSKLGCKQLEYELSFNKPDVSWKKIFETIYRNSCGFKDTLLNITTMPREIIWTILNFLRERKIKIYYIYNSPERYDDNWLSRDAKIPRLVFKLSGVSRLGNPTKLVLLSGFDLERSKQLINHFEPTAILLGVQQGEQFNNEKLNIKKHIAEFTNQQGFEVFYVDAYTDDHGYGTIEKVVDPHLEKANVILSSLGPKLTSISLFKYHLKHPETGLAYAPSGEYNIEYSTGIGKSYFGEI